MALQNFEKECIFRGRVVKVPELPSRLFVTPWIVVFRLCVHGIFQAGGRVTWKYVEAEK